MIVDTIRNASKYYCIHPLFARAFEYILSANTTSIEDGRYPIDGDDLKAIVSIKKGMTEAESATKFECHDKHIDIQFCIYGIERIGWKPRGTCIQQKGEYNPEKDVVFYGDAPDMYFELRDGQFAIFFPEDVHAPMIGKELIKKMVVKVSLSYPHLTNENR